MPESEALRQSFPTITPRLLRRAQRLAEELSEEDNPLRMEELDVAFHVLLYSGSPNTRLGRLIESLRREVYASITCKSRISASASTMQRIMRRCWRPARERTSPRLSRCWLDI